MPENPKKMSKKMPDRMSEDMSEKMTDSMSEIYGQNNNVRKDNCR